MAQSVVLEMLVGIYLIILFLLLHFARAQTPILLPRRRPHSLLRSRTDNRPGDRKSEIHRFLAKSHLEMVTDVEHMTREDALTSMETFRYHIDLPEDEMGLPDWITYDRGAWTIVLPGPALEYPRGCGEWDSRPWVFISKPGGEPTKLSKSVWEWNDASRQHLTVHWPQVEWEDGIDILYKRELKRSEEQWPRPLECMPDDLFRDWTGPSYGMEEESPVSLVPERSGTLS